ncbi:MAG: nucleotidyltransferase [Bacteroidetes bacterium]|nr:MAG: nucleotidyltransferase [Bacteroidota bacterium]
MENKDIRWHQRFQNYEKVLSYLEEALRLEEPTIVQKAGIIQFFEMSFELAWNLIKDYLEEQGFIDIKSPRDALKKGFEIGLISNGHGWLELLQNRNLTSHTYDEETATVIVSSIRIQYHRLLNELYRTMKQKL